MNTTDRQEVTDGNWDNNGGTCGFRFQTTRQEVQNCHPGTFVTSVHWVADPYGFTHWFDNLNTAGRVWNESADNSNTASQPELVRVSRHGASADQPAPVVVGPT